MLIIHGKESANISLADNDSTFKGFQNKVFILY